MTRAETEVRAWVVAPVLYQSLVTVRRTDPRMRLLKVGVRT